MAKTPEQNRTFILLFDEEQFESKDIISIINSEKPPHEETLRKKIKRSLNDYFKAKDIEIIDYGISMTKNILPIYFSAHITLNKIDFYKRFKLLPVIMY